MFSLSHPAEHGVLAADPAREQCEAFGLRRRAPHRAHLEGAIVVAFQQLAASLGAAEGGVGGEPALGAVVIDEVAQAHVLNALALAGRGREDHRLGDLATALTGQVDDRALAIFLLLRDARRDRRRARWIDDQSAAGRPVAGAESDGRDVTLADAAQRHDEANAPVRRAALIRVDGDAGVEQRRRLKRVFLREVGADQYCAVAVDRTAIDSQAVHLVKAT